jgi:hypothetical protein
LGPFTLTCAPVAGSSAVHPLTLTVDAAAETVTLNQDPEAQTIRVGSGSGAYASSSFSLETTTFGGITGQKSYALHATSYEVLRVYRYAELATSFTVASDVSNDALVATLADVRVKSEISAFGPTHVPMQPLPDYIGSICAVTTEVP